MPLCYTFFTINITELHGEITEKKRIKLCVKNSVTLCYTFFTINITELHGEITEKKINKTLQKTQ